MFEFWFHHQWGVAFEYWLVTIAWEWWWVLDINLRYYTKIYIIHLLDCFQMERWRHHEKINKEIRFSWSNNWYWMIFILQSGSEIHILALCIVVHNAGITKLKLLSLYILLKVLMQLSNLFSVQFDGLFCVENITLDVL